MVCGVERKKEDMGLGLDLLFSVEKEVDASNIDRETRQTVCMYGRICVIEGKWW